MHLVIFKFLWPPPPLFVQNHCGKMTDKYDLSSACFFKFQVTVINVKLAIRYALCNVFQLICLCAETLYTLPLYRKKVNWQHFSFPQYWISLILPNLVLKCWGKITANPRVEIRGFGKKTMTPWIVPFILLIYILVPGTNIGPIMHKLYVLFVIYSIYIPILALTKTLGTRRASFRLFVNKWVECNSHCHFDQPLFGKHQK